MEVAEIIDAMVKDSETHWSEIRLRVRRQVADLAGLILIEAGANGVEIEDPATVTPSGIEVWTGGRPVMEPDGPEAAPRSLAGRSATETPDDIVVVKALYPPERGLAPAAEVRASIAALELPAGDRPVMEVEKVPSADWSLAWRDQFHTLKAGERLVIRPSWEEYQPAPGESVVTIDPGLAFGTGTHPTTLLCLRYLEEMVRPGDDLLDAGTGSAILAIAAAKLGASRVTAVDADPLAIKAARENVTLNGVAGQVAIALSDIGAFLPPGEMPVSDTGESGVDEVGLKSWDGIFFNISADFMLAHAAAMHRRARRWAIISGYPGHRRDEVLSGLVRAGWSRQSVTDIVEGGWGALLARKPR